MACAADSKEVLECIEFLHNVNGIISRLTETINEMTIANSGEFDFSTIGDDNYEAFTLDY
jgi:hypothetical protein